MKVQTLVRSSLGHRPSCSQRSFIGPDGRSCGLLIAWAPHNTGDLAFEAFDTAAQRLASLHPHESAACSPATHRAVLGGAMEAMVGGLSTLGERAPSINVSASVIWALQCRECCYLAHVGPAVALLVRGRQVRRLTDSHTYEAAQPPVEAPFGSVPAKYLSSVLGASSGSDFHEVKLLEGDRLFLCNREWRELTTDDDIIGTAGLSLPRALEVLVSRHDGDCTRDDLTVVALTCAAA